jgi:hypothetical protein
MQQPNKTAIVISKIYKGDSSNFKVFLFFLEGWATYDKE